jgi:hypothetical protein
MIMKNFDKRYSTLLEDFSEDLDMIDDIDLDYSDEQEDDFAGSDSSAAGEFFGKLFAARDFLHLAHLKISGDGSFAGHKALNEAYDELLDLVDGIVETYQGTHGVVDINIPATTSDNDAAGYLEELLEYIEAAREGFEESWMQNEIDEVQKLISTTLYKINTLK